MTPIPAESPFNDPLTGGKRHISKWDRPLRANDAHSPRTQSGDRTVSSTDRPDVTTDSPALNRWPTFRLDHVIDDGRCTVYPSTHSADRRTGAWITAHGDAFLALDEVR